MRNYYEELGVSPTASQADIHEAYRRLVKTYHPDKHAQNELRDLALEKLKVINEAYGILSSPHQRKAYDAQLQQAPRLSASENLEKQLNRDPRSLVQKAFFWFAATAGTALVTRLFRHVLATVFVLGLFGLWYLWRKKKKKSDD